MRQELQVPALEVSYEDDPRVLRDAATEDYSLHVVPDTARSSRRSLSMAWLSLYGAMFWVVLAATVSLAVGTVQTLIGLCAAVVFFGAANAVISRHATRNGLTVALFSRAIFGYGGAALATLLFGATAIYLGVFEGSVIAVALDTYIGGLSLKLWYLVVVLYSVPLVFGGVQRWLDRFNAVLLPFYIAGLVAAVVWTIVEYGYSGAWFSYKPPAGVGISGPGWVFAFTVYMGAAVMMMCTFDFGRFGRKSDERFNGLVTFGPVFYIPTMLINGLVGIFLAHTIPAQGPVSEITVVLGLVAMMGFFGVLFIWVSQTRIGTANFYLASSNLQSFFARVFKLYLPRWVWACVAGAIIYAIMLTDVFSFIVDALRYQGVFIVAWVGITLTHILSRKVRALTPVAEFRPGRVPYLNPGGLVAWILSAGIGIVLLETAGSWGGTWSSPITLVLSAGFYALALTVANRGWFVMERPYDPRTEVDDPWEARVRCGHCGKSYIALEMDRDPEHGHIPICAECAAESATFHRHARMEAQGSNGRIVAEVLGPVPEKSGL